MNAEPKVERHSDQRDGIARAARFRYLSLYLKKKSVGLALRVLLVFRKSAIVAVWQSGLRRQHWHGWHRQCGGLQSHTQGVPSFRFVLLLRPAYHFESILREVLFVVRAATDIIKPDSAQNKRLLFLPRRELA